MRSRLWLGAVLGALSLVACSSPKSIILLSLQSATPTPITGVTKVIVAVSQSQGPKVATLIYPPKGADSLTIDQVSTTDLTVSFSGGQSGTIDLAVTVEDVNGCTIGFGQTATVLRKGGIVTATALIAAAADCSTADGGTTDAAPTKFPGCDPTAATCPSNQTCQVDCKTHMGECTMGGTGTPGALCDTNADCVAGSQCFDYTSTGCGVKVCLRFCDDDNGCGTTSPTTSALSVPSDGGSDGAGDSRSDAADAAPDAGGGDGGSPGRVEAGSIGTKSLCAGPVQCGAIVTAYHTCTFACDPRLISVKSGSRCPTGLSCLVVLGMDQVDCACPEQTRVGTDG
ncbi:MAG TPA: hypothetical protein VK989_15870, partial [Polyangia bacterium]|nr:hypothetical protein [Polyangia bacterium]